VFPLPGAAPFPGNGGPEGPKTAIDREKFDFLAAFRSVTDANGIVQGITARNNGADDCPTVTGTWPRLAPPAARRPVLVMPRVAWPGATHLPAQLFFRHLRTGPKG
jgi:hypothetical protein